MGALQTRARACAMVPQHHAASGCGGSRWASLRCLRGERIVLI